MQQHRIVVLGAGYAGAVAAGRLARRLRREDAAITLVNAEPDFVERVRMHELAAGRRLRTRPLAAMFAGTGVALRTARVTAHDAGRRTVTLEGPDGTEELAYDTLVHALGSGWDDHGVPGVAEHAHDIASRPGARRLQQRLAGLPAGGAVAVVGGGLTGLEAAAEIAEARPDLDVALLVSGALGARFSPRGRAHLRKVLDGLGVTVHEHTEAAAVTADAITTAAGTTIPADATVWAAGFAVHPLTRDTALRTTATGQIAVDRTMRSLSHPDVYAIGDAAAADGPNGTQLRMSCASGVPAAWQAADALAARLTGRPVPTVSIRYFNQCVSLGRRNGLIQYVTADDRAKPAALTGRLAALYKEAVCRGAAWGVAHPTLGRRVRRHPAARAARPAADAPAAETPAGTAA